MELPILLASIFSPLAAVVAFVITYAEYAKHLVDRKKVLKKALGMALVTFAFFMTVPPLLIWFFLFR